MPNTPNASFIPKQGPVRKVRQTASHQVHLVSVVSYVLFTSTLIASAGVFLYNRHLQGQLDGEVQKLGGVIGDFSDADMETVREFNVRLHQSQGRLAQSISITSIFEALEAATLKSAAITELSIKRDGDSQVLVNAKVNTDSFDGSLFQRGVYERNAVIKNVEITDLTLNQATDKNSTPGVSFLAKITVPLKDIPYTPDKTSVPQTIDTQPATSTASTTDTLPAQKTSSSSVASSTDKKK